VGSVEDGYIRCRWISSKGKGSVGVELGTSPSDFGGRLVV